MAILDVMYVDGDINYSGSLTYTLERRDIIFRHILTIDDLAENLLSHQARIFALEGRLRTRQDDKILDDGGLIATKMVGRAAKDWGWVPEIYFISNNTWYRSVAERIGIHYIDKSMVRPHEAARLLIRKLKLLRKRM